MRADAAMARDLHEIAELLSSEFVKASMADALRAVVKVGLAAPSTGAREEPEAAPVRSNGYRIANQSDKTH